MNIFVQLFSTTFVVASFNNSASMNLISILAMKLHQGGRSSLQDEFREGRSKSVVVPETIDTVRQLIVM